MGQVLQGAHLVLCEGALATDVKDRAFGTQGRRDPRCRVGAAGTRRGHNAAETAGLPRIAVRRMRRHLFMTHVDDADVLVEATVVNIDDVPAAEREDRVHAFVL